MSETLSDRIAALLGDDETHWTVVLDRALRQGVVEPGPDARPQVLKALSDAERLGLVSKASTGTYRKAGA